MTTPEPPHNTPPLPGYSYPPPAPPSPGYPPPGGYGAPPYYPPPVLPPQAYAFWGRRVLASLADALFAIPLIVMYVATISTVHTSPGGYSYHYSNVNGYETRTETGDVTVGAAFWPLLIITLVVLVATIAFEIWNRIVRQGRTGSSLGKQWLGITVISEITGTPIGPGRTFVRQLAHILDGFCYIGYLWPLWDPKRQTFADKIMNTVVVPRTSQSA